MVPRVSLGTGTRQGAQGDGRELSTVFPPSLGGSSTLTSSNGCVWTRWHSAAHLAPTVLTACVSSCGKSRELVGCWWGAQAGETPPAVPPPAQAASQLLSPHAACAGGPQQPCSGNGRCDGDGTRRGTGLCVCSPGYGGPFCAECGDGYYEASRNKSHLICAGMSGGLAQRGGGLWGRGAALGWVQAAPSFLRPPRSPLSTECYRACGRCTGPEDSSCLRCKRGWVLHEHRCIGEDCRGTQGGQRLNSGLLGGLRLSYWGSAGLCVPLPVLQTSMSVARRWRTAEPTSSASTRRAPMSAEVRREQGEGSVQVAPACLGPSPPAQAVCGWAGRGLWQ